MIIFHPKGLISYKFFQQFPEVICYSSTKKTGLINKSDDFATNIKQILTKLDMQITNYVAMEQIHRAQIACVSHKMQNQVLKGIDGLFTDNKNLYLFAKTADCIPLFIYIPKIKLIGLIHVGWRGLLEGIIQKSLEIVTKSNLKHAYIVIGPHIGICCYNIRQDRAIKFTQKYGRGSWLTKRNQQSYLSLGLLVKQILISTGILGSQIELIKECTACNDLYYSYRRDKNISERMLHMIGMKN